tara:strand:+ start:503 stop:943 length:441 start_codon:yes stop_codon:yes gene_type:complete
MLNVLYKKLLFKVFIFPFIIFIIFFNKKYALALDPITDRNILNSCSNHYNCVLESWQVSDASSSFIELKEILQNTPRIEIIDIQKDYIHALAISRIMKYVDDIEIKKYSEDNILKIKSKSRNGFYDLGVNKRRVNTLHFRLIDIYK